MKPTQATKPKESNKKKLKIQTKTSQSLGFLRKVKVETPQEDPKAKLSKNIVEIS